MLRGCPPPPAISTALAAHLSRNNTRSNYITLSGKGAVALPASNLFSLSLYTFHETFSNLWPKSAKSDPRPQTLGKRRGGKKRERRQSAKVASFHFNTFFSLPFLMFELGQHWTRPASICLMRDSFRQLILKRSYDKMTHWLLPILN